LHLPDREQIDCNDIRAVWYRKPTEPQISKSIDETQREYAYDETRNDIEGFYKYLEDRYWISPIDCIRRAANKPLQLRLAQTLGFRIPDTIITNSPHKAVEFFNKHHGNLIYKTISGGAIYSRASRWAEKSVHGAVYTTPLSNYSESDFAAVELCPCLFQELVPKLFELRVTVVHETVFAAEIHSQADEAARTDWRLKGDTWQLPHRVHALPPVEADRCRELVRRLGLQFGAIDLIYTPNRQYVFLEINPNGQYGWIEDATGLPINRAIADALCTADAAG
jgi:glutathione synthase/RimK-type ligase-like ATP-grasp enzyme